MTRRNALAVIAAAGVCRGGMGTVDPPALSSSGMPFLTTGPDRSIYLSWTDFVAEKEHALRFSRWTGSGWTAPETIASGKNWFVNWGDFPSIAVRGDGSMLAHWLPRAAGGGTYGYGIRIARRDRGMAVWQPIHGMSLDQKTDYAGFLTFAERGDAAAYLAPPRSGQHGAGEHDHRKTVRVLLFGPDGSPGEDVEIDANACSCCQTAIGRTRNGFVVAYRDRLPGEIRDISIVRYADGVWTKPQALHADGWHINGCPTDGPSIAADGGVVAVSWLTRANGLARIQAAFSVDDGVRFGKPVRVDSGNPLGRPAMAWCGGSTYAVVWLEKVGDDVEIRLRRVSVPGRMWEPVRIARVPVGRASGFPKIAIHGEQVLLAWRDERVRARLVTRSQIEEMEHK
jgi:hypothetical protein